MPLPQPIPINTAPENVWAVLDAVESDCEDDLADVMKDSDENLWLKMRRKKIIRTKGDEENADNSISETNQSLHAIVHDMNTTDDKEDKVQSGDEVIGNADGDGNKNEKDTQKKSIGQSLQSTYQPKRKLDAEVLIDIHPLDNPQKKKKIQKQVFEKIAKFDKFLQRLKLESERYGAQNSRRFKVFLNKLRAFIGINFVMGSHKLPTFRSYSETIPSPFLSCIANVLTRERFKEILSNLHFQNNEDALPNNHPDQDRTVKVRWLIDYLNKRFLRAMDPEVDQSVDEHMIKFKGRTIMREHIKNKPIKWGFKMWYRCAPKTGYFYELDICTGKKETSEFGLGESVVLHLTEKLNGSFSRIFFGNFFTSSSLMRELTENSLYGIGVVRQNRKLLPKIETPAKKKAAAEAKNKVAEDKSKKKKKTKELAFVASFTSDKSFNREDSDFLVNKDGIVALRWKNSKVVMLLINI